MPARSTVIASVGVLLALAGPCSARAQPVDEPPPQRLPEGLTTLGVLTCSLGGSDAGAVGQTRDMLCLFRIGSEGTGETYTGTIRSVGQTQALYAKGTILLAVKAPVSTALGPGMLEQAYAAETASVSAAAPLVGDTNRVIVLQPWMEEEGRVAAGKARPDVTIISVELKLQASPA